MKSFARQTAFFLALTLICFVPASSPAGSKESPKAPWFVSYRDGSANGYRFWQDKADQGAQFEYSPVQPKDSSTGMYSGGDPKSGAMSQKQVKELWEGIQKLESDQALHLKEHMKGTGAFKIKTAEGAREFIIQDGDPLETWNKFLSAFRSGKQGLINPGGK